MTATRHLACILIALTCPLLANAEGTTPAQLQKDYEASAGRPARPAQGQAFFTSRHGGEWSCASCHGARPTAQGRHVLTDKPLDPLAPAFHPAAFTDVRRVEKWFKRNCRDVLQRECTSAEKADVLAWLQSLR